MTNSKPQLRFNSELTEHSYWLDNSEVKSLSQNDHQTLVDQLLVNYQTERQDLENVLAAIKSAQSDRIRLCLLDYLASSYTNNSFAVKYKDCIVSSSKDTEAAAAQFFQTLNCAYWDTLLSALNLNKLIPSEFLRPITRSLTTKYLDENPKAFTLENIVDFFTSINTLINVETTVEDFKKFAEHEELSFEILKNGKLKINTPYKSVNQDSKMQGYIFSCMYIMDKEWFNTSGGVNKPYAESFKGIEFGSQSAKMLLSMEKPQAKMFVDFYGIHLQK